MKKRTKIICTMGPNTNNKELLKRLAEEGMDIARFNFSHGDYEEQKFRMDSLKEIRSQLKLPIAILLDTKGPEIRTGLLEKGQKVFLEEGKEIILTNKACIGNADKVQISYENLFRDVKIGSCILIDDGLIELRVMNIENEEISCLIVNGGELGEKKGVNVPNVSVNLPAITEKDKEDIVWGIGQGIDFVAASFIRNANAVKEIRQLLNEHGGHNISIISKIENSEGVNNIDEIIEASDGIMVARGDLGVEIPASQVPHVQKMIIKKCNMAYKPVITATQMLDSMIRNPRPTRAEVADVANAIYDGTDCIMLSGETAMGKYPVEAVQMMVDIAVNAERDLDTSKYRQDRLMEVGRSISSAVGFAAVETARNINASCIVTPTMSSSTPRIVSNFRPEVPIYGVSPNDWALRKMQILWGVTPVKGYEEDSTENIISHAMYVVKRAKKVNEGDLVVFTAGDPATNTVTGEGSITNIMHIMQA